MKTLHALPCRLETKKIAVISCQVFNSLTNMGRHKLTITDEEKKVRRRIQIAKSKAKLKARDPEKFTAIGSLQRKAYRKKHPESVSKEKNEKSAKRAQERRKTAKERLKAARLAMRSYVFYKLLRA